VYQVNQKTVWMGVDALEASFLDTVISGQDKTHGVLSLLLAVVLPTKFAPFDGLLLGALFASFASQ
jgi:hypothetical protein